jgi:hypothetical protein
VEFPTATLVITFHLNPRSDEYWRRWTSQLGALVCGRTLFDFTDGWGERHTMDVPVVVVTHDVPTDWVDAIASASGPAGVPVIGLEDASLMYVVCPRMTEEGLRARYRPRIALRYDRSRPASLSRSAKTLASL